MKLKLDHKVYKKIYRFNEMCGLQKVINRIPDKNYLNIIYRLQLGRNLNLEDPQTYNEKLQWLKLNDQNDMYTKLADKYEVRKYVEEKIGKEYLIPLLGVWEKFDDINFQVLPDKFVLKCTHDSGGIAVCHKKDNFNIKAAKKKMTRLMKNNYFNYLREWVYKNISPKIIAEQLITDGSGEDRQQLRDYKFFCFDGEPQFLMVAQGRFGITKSNFYDINFKLLPFRIGNPNFDEILKKPENFDEMLEVCKRLSQNIKHVRIDLYNISGKIYFGELTFYHWGGISIIEPEEWDLKIGRMLKI